MLSVSGQETTVLATNPTSVRWNQIKTPGFKVLYANGFEAEAQRMANTLEHIREPEAKTMQALPRRIPIVLHNYSTSSNGFVTMAPWRSEFYAMPSQDYNFIGGNDWLNMLATHEYRHMAQFQRSITGFNKFLFYVFGQEATSAMAFASAPQWFWEGDAVAIETAFTPYGRGRMPAFDRVFRMNLLEGRTFNYNKQYLRSYKHFIPNHYVLGYEMISYLRKKTNNADVWSSVAGRTWRVPFIPFAFSRSLKKETGMSTPQLYKNMANELKSQYEQELSKVQLTPFEVVSVRKGNAYTNFLYPQLLEDGSIAAVKRGIGDVDQIIVFKEGELPAKKFLTAPFNETGFLSAAGNTVVWNEYRFDPRWPIQNYSVVRGFDFNSKEKNSVSHSRYAGASISPDGKKVVTVETNTSYQTSIVVIDYPQGNFIKKFDNPSNAFYSMARWSNDGQRIVALKNLDGGKSVVVIDFQAGTERELRAPSKENIGHPILTDVFLLFNSPYSGIDNIYALDLKTGKEFQVTSVRYGAYNPCLSADGKTLYFNNQARDGMDIVKMDFNSAGWRPKEEIAIPAFNTYQHLVEQENNAHLLETVPDSVYASSKYSKLGHALNIHSWGGYVNTDLTRASIGITSKDILSTTQLKAGYSFDIQERTGEWKATATVQALYPIFDFNYKQGNRSLYLGQFTYRKVNSPGDTVTLTDPLSIGWNERSFEGGIRLPWNLTRSKFVSDFSISNYVGLTSVWNFRNSIDGGGRILTENLPQYILENYLDNGNLIYNSFAATYRLLMRRSSRDINSKYGFAGFLNSSSTPFNVTDYRGSNFAATGYVFLPGLFKHHSLWGYGAFQSTSIKLGRTNSNEELSSNYIFRNEIPLPRGILSYIDRHERMYSMSANYTMPLWYPDVAIGPWVNFKRLRANAFVDYAFGDDPRLRQYNPQFKSQYQYLSVGGELKIDINIMRFLPELDLGIRYSYGIQPTASKFEVLLGTFNF